MGSFYYIIVYAVVLFIGLFIFMYMLYRHFVNKIDKQQRENMQAVLNAQENERKQIALEVHDNLGPLLSITNMQLEAAIENIPREHKEYLEEAYEQLKQAIDMCRNISHDLTPLLNTGNSLQEMLEDYIRRVRNTKQICIHFEYELGEMNIAEQASASLCRIVLELITNTIKHANAKNINIVIAQQQHTALVYYRDDGIGMKDNKIPGIGMKNIQSRVALMNGIMQVGQSEQSGFNVKIKIPVKYLNRL